MNVSAPSSSSPESTTVNADQLAGGRGGRGRGGRGGGRGGRGGGRGGRGGYVPRKMQRHRSLSGKHGTNMSGPRGDRNYERPAAKREKKEHKPNSGFALLHSLLCDAATIAEYIREYHSSDSFRNMKSMNTFLQAISQRPEVTYEELMSGYKSEVFTTLERLFSLYALGKHPMTPSAHEFLIRCEQCGVRVSSWGDGVESLPYIAPNSTPSVEVEGGAPVVAPSPVVTPSVSLLSARELLKKMAALDPLGRLRRQIEMSSTVADLYTCSKKLDSLIPTFSTASGLADSGAAQTSRSSVEVDYTTKCQLISKLVSKARRVVTAPSPAAVEKQQEEVEAEAEEEEGVEKSDATPAAIISESAEEHAVAAPSVVEISDEDRLIFQSVTSLVFQALRRVLESRPPAVVQQPLSKFLHFATWCSTNALLAEDVEKITSVLENQTEVDMAEQASQLEAVMRIKSLTAGDEEGFVALCDELWSAGNNKYFHPSSVDVLSAIGVAASAGGISDAVKRTTAERLIQTQVSLPSTTTLPRRALRFVNEERNKLKQADVARQLKNEAEKLNSPV